MSAFAWLRDMSYHIECTSSRLLNLHQLGESVRSKEQVKQEGVTGEKRGTEEGLGRGALEES